VCYLLVLLTGVCPRGKDIGRQQEKKWRPFPFSMLPAAAAAGSARHIAVFTSRLRSIEPTG